MSQRSCVPIDDGVISSGFFDSFDYVLTDCDGVLWTWNHPIPGSVETIQALKKMGKHAIYVTNNSSKSREEYLKRFQAFGYPATLDDIVPSSYSAATYLASRNFRKKVYVITDSGIGDELEEGEIRHLSSAPDAVGDKWSDAILNMKLDPEVGAVIVGFDPDINYHKIAEASSYLKNPDTLFIITNRDEIYPTDGPIVIPGVGSLVGAIEVASGRTATNIGKPEKCMLDCIQLTHPDIDYTRCLMIGDKLNTDILMGTRHGLKTLLVLSGVNSVEDVRKFEKSANEEDHLLVPDYYLPSLGDLRKFIKN